MNFEESELREFAQLWKDEFHEMISMDEAKRHAASLLNLLRVFASAETTNEIKLP